MRFQLRRIRGEITDITLVILAVTVVPGLAGGLSRIPDLGFLPFMYLHVALTLIIVGAAVFRRRLPFIVRATIPAAMFFVAGMSGLMTLGAIAGSFMFLLAPTFFAFAMMGPVAGVGLLIASIGAVTGTFFALRYGLITPAADPNFYWRDTTSWINLIASMVMIMGVISGTVWAMTRNLVRAVDAEIANSERLRAETEVRRQVEAQRDRAERLRETQKLEAIGQLTGGLAHRFNNLLGIVVGNLDEIGQHIPKDNERLRRQQQSALEASLRGAEIIRSLLAVAQSQPLAAERGDLNREVEAFLVPARTSAGSDVTVRSDLCPGTLLATLDTAALHQCLLILIINARDAMQKQAGDKSILLRTRRHRVDAQGDSVLSPGWYALIEVVDNGDGMSDAVRSRAFEPFFSTKEQGKGTGLGLAMVYGYAAQVGGKARIESTQGRGTTVQLYLPMDQDAAQ